jgi:PPOX class probable F420-dependent enzyme
MLTQQQVRFVSKPKIGRLGTTCPDGAPHIAPIWYRFEDGAFFIITERRSRKFRNIEHDPRVVLCIDDDETPYHTVIVRGRVEVLPPPDAAWRLALAIRYLGEEGGRRYVEENVDPNNVMLRIVPEDVAGW